MDGPRALAEGEGLVAAGQHELGIARLQEAVRLLPKDGRAAHMLAFALATSARPDEAEVWFESALALMPTEQTVWFNLGNLQRERPGGSSRARNSYQQALRLAPQWADAYINLGVASGADMTSALVAYRHALALQPTHSHALCNIVHASTWLAHWRGRDALLRRLRTRLDGANRSNGDDNILVHAMPWQVLSYPFREEVGQRVAEAHALVARQAVRPETLPRRRRPRQTRRARRLELAYLSSDLREAHPVGQLMSRVFGLHRRSNFVVRCLDSSGGTSPISPAARRGCDRLEIIRPTASGAMALPEDIDLLIDLNGHTEGSRTDLLAASTVPVRSLAVAYPASLGGHHLVHYLMTDAASVWPRGVRLPTHLYPERLTLLPIFFLSSDHYATFAHAAGRGATSAAGADEMAGGSPGCSMSSFSQMYKLRPSTLQAWAGAMRRLPARCSLRLIAFEQASAPALHDEIAALGIASARLEWLPKLSREEHMRRAPRSSMLSLDTPGYNGGTSGLDALWAGLPLLTLPLRQWAARMGGGLMRAAAMPPGEVHSHRAIDDTLVALLGGVDGLVTGRHAVAGRLLAPVAIEEDLGHPSRLR